MSAWDSTTGKIIRFADQPWPHSPGWSRVDCGCCNGLEWGGEEPRECRTCGGNGMIARHDASGALAHYPGGPFCGVA